MAHMLSYLTFPSPETLLYVRYSSCYWFNGKQSPSCCWRPEDKSDSAEERFIPTFHHVAGPPLRLSLSSSQSRPRTQYSSLFLSHLPPRPDPVPNPFLSSSPFANPTLSPVPPPPLSLLLPSPNFNPLLPLSQLFIQYILPYRIMLHH